MAKKSHLVGLVSPQVLEAVEADSLHAVAMDLEACDILEIRYDFFERKEWTNLSGRIRRIAPKTPQIGTIRLKRDGGTFPNREANHRFDLWNEILKAAEVPEWLDLEQDCLYDFQNLKNLADIRGTKILISQHNFLRIPAAQELEDFAQDCLRVGAAGLKIAAMSNSETDSDRLYAFSKKFAKNFELFAAFGMGETGKASRLWSLKEGANLTYGSIENSAAPGQIDVLKMRRALENFEEIRSPFELSAFLAKF